ncbi:MAG TPA: cell division protein ZapA [Longimicrobium sp.]|nr:cell division protein ZapA [Longimicrobium sp.]
MSRPSRRPPPPRHTVAVEIAGEKHVLRSDVPPEYTRRVASHVDATIRALPGFQTLEPFRAATLAALSITDELFHARDEIRRLREEAERRTAELADVLEAAEAASAEKRSVRRPAAAPPPLPATDTPPPLPDAATPPPLPPQASTPAAPSRPSEPHPAWASAPAEEKRDAAPSLFSDDEPELNLPPPDE